MYSYSYMPGREACIMASMPSRVIVMALRMASISQGFLKVRMAFSSGSRLCADRLG